MARHYLPFFPLLLSPDLPLLRWPLVRLGGDSQFPDGSSAAAAAAPAAAPATPGVFTLLSLCGQQKAPPSSFRVVATAAATAVALRGVLGLFGDNSPSFGPLSPIWARCCGGRSWLPGCSLSSSLPTLSTLSMSFAVFVLFRFGACLEGGGSSRRERC